MLSEGDAMCSPTRCQTCGNITWTGCGMHIEEVKASVPPQRWCPGHPDPVDSPGAAGQPGAAGRLRRLFGR
jgi:hypothetical protein